MGGDRLMYTAGPLTMTSYGKILTMKPGRTGMRYQKYFALASGAWKASFDTQIGEQHYTDDRKADKDQLTGKATNDRGSTDIAEGTVQRDDIFFVENITFQDTKLRSAYTGKVAGDEIKFTRKVRDFATEKFVGKRVG
jgi:hypothetical protein